MKGLEALERLGKFRNEDGMFAFQSKDYFLIKKELEESEMLKREIEILHFIRNTFSMRNALLQVCDKNSEVLPERKRLVREYLLKEVLL